MRLKLTITYDGRPFEGWQSQPGSNTVQDHLKRALEETAKEPMHLSGSGRTDTGVHALAQVAHFDAPDHLSMNPYNWVPALNTKLPASIRVLFCEEVSPDFHARFSATGKVYRYDLCTDPILSPFKAGLAWHLPRSLDAEVLQQALDLFVGQHDFRGFAANRGNETPETSWVRIIASATVAARDDGYRITYRGDGFMYKMVRLLTGGAVHAAQGRISLHDLGHLLDQTTSTSPRKSPVCAPADGLYLEEVIYGR
jgi:tRNA pseudouridine38-40 synthase